MLRFGAAVPVVVILALAAVPAPTSAGTVGSLAFHDVRYDDLLAEGNAGQVRISFVFEQNLHDVVDGKPVGRVLQDVGVNVTFPTFAEASPPVSAKLDLGDVPNGIHAYAFVLDLPPLPYYCVEIALGEWAFQTERRVCTTSAWEADAANGALDARALP